MNIQLVLAETESALRAGNTEVAETALPAKPSKGECIIFRGKLYRVVTVYVHAGGVTVFAVFSEDTHYPI